MEMYDLLASYLQKETIEKLKEEMEKETPNKGLLLNVNKTNSAVLNDFTTMKQDNIDKSLYLYDSSIDKPGKNILHECGAYYILDPSADIISQNLISNEYEVVLDMCAAPGGKTISYALKHPRSLIISNDYSSSRAVELAKNIERMGLANVIVTSYDPSFFLDNYQQYFDKIILDTPCSGTGMFRKSAEVKDDWSYEKTLNLLPLQDKLLSIAYDLLKKGGILSYSTCSFLKEEDEDRINNILSLHSDLSVLPLKEEEGYYEGTLKGCYHLFPSLYKKGEGHFVCFLKKDGTLSSNSFNLKHGKYNKELNLYEFNYLNETYALPYFDSIMFKLKSLRFGLKLSNDSKYSKCPYDHALSHYLSSENSLQISKEEAEKYLKGEEISIASSMKDGIVILSYLGCNIGYGKKVGNKVKNYYPKGLRKSL